MGVQVLPKEPGHETPPSPTGKVIFNFSSTASLVLQISGRTQGKAVHCGGAGSTLPARWCPPGCSQPGAERHLTCIGEESHALQRTVAFNGSSGQVPASASPARQHIMYRRL